MKKLWCMSGLAWVLALSSPCCWSDAGEGSPGQAVAVSSFQNSPEAPTAGAASEFWAYRPPLAQPKPEVRRADWPRERLDFFILSRLESEGLGPSREADRRTLIRRATFDITGLPPTPDEVAAFVTDSAPGAYERLIERLLASPRFGERLASLWLPLARYAEDQAHQVGDDTSLTYPNAYRYRDWVIDAFNRDLPYDQFLRLQIAADKIEGRDRDLAALGFLGLGPKYYDRGRLEVQADEWEDRVDTVCRTILGMTVACARCHDHKFDPIPTRDYYALAGVFASTRMVNRIPGSTNLSERTRADRMPSETLHIVEDGPPKDLAVFIRGRVTSQGPVAERGFLSILEGKENARFREGSGRRELAERLTDRDNPLTARVFVNRLWGMYFGKPLVATPSDFGHSGMFPSHSALLDDLAIRFMENGWSVRAMTREMVRSATYRQVSEVNEDGLSRDPGNRDLWRMNRRRLSVEQWRDALLYLSGDLHLEQGRSDELDAPKNHKRTVFSRISRLKLNDVLMQFDYPDANVHAERRASTTTATQKLFLLNGPFVLDRSAAFASRLRDDAPDSEEQRIRLAYGWISGREPSKDELELAQSFLHPGDGVGETGSAAWDQYAHALLISNQMMYVD